MIRAIEVRKIILQITLVPLVIVLYSTLDSTVRQNDHMKTIHCSFHFKNSEILYEMSVLAEQDE